MTSYLDAAKTSGRRPFTVVELDLDYCTRTYGQAPCAAVVGITGSQKCFNTRANCQDSANYVSAAKTYRFSDVQLPPCDGLIATPCVISKSFTPTKMDQQGGFGVRGSVTVMLQEFSHDDVAVDKYVSERPTPATVRGTFFARLLTRNRYYAGRPMRVKTGFLAADGSVDLSSIRTMTYILEAISGPNAKGQVQLMGKDLLKMADETRAQAPRLSTGKLLAAITDVAATATLTPVGVGALEYPASGYIAIDSEVIAFTRSADVLTLTRAQQNTVADGHSADAKVQLCLVITGQAPIDALYSILTTYTAIPPAFIPLAAWQAEASGWIDNFTISAFITAPTAVADLAKEISQQCFFNLWWDEVNSLVRMRVVRPARSSEVTELSDYGNMLGDAFSMSEDATKRITEVWVYYGQIDPTKYKQTKDQVENYLYVYAAVAAAEESAALYGDRRVMQVFSRWFTVTSITQASQLASRLLNKFRNPPRTYTFSLDAKDFALWTGGMARLTNAWIQAADGTADTKVVQVVEASEAVSGGQAKFIAVDDYFNGRYANITEDDMVDFSAASVAQKLDNGFVCKDDGLMNDLTEGYKII